MLRTRRAGELLVYATLSGDQVHSNIESMLDCQMTRMSNKAKGMKEREQEKAGTWLGLNTSDYS